MHLVDLPCIILLLFVALEVSGGGKKRSQVPQGYQSSSDVPVDKNRCQFSIDDDQLTSPLPLLLTPDKTNADFLYPDAQHRTIKLKNGEKIKLACPGSNNYIKGIPSNPEVTEIEVDCVGANSFRVGSKTFFIDGVVCDLQPNHDYTITQKPCNGAAKLVEIGFDLPSQFLSTIDVCWDDATKTVYWARSSITPKIGSMQHRKRPKGFKSSKLYGNLDFDKAYSFDEQLETMENLIGSDKLARQYINNENGKDLFLSRGHLTAKSDLFYGAAQMSTFWYMNVAPQWQSFNKGNWEKLERNIRDFATTRTSSLIVYTGTYGQMSVKNVQGIEVPFYLHANGNKKNISVPKFFWKVIYDPLTKEGTAFVGVNDPWATIKDKGIKICTDISSHIPWLHWIDANNSVQGLSYACKVDDLRRSVPTVPDILVQKILT